MQITLPDPENPYVGDHAAAGAYWQPGNYAGTMFGVPIEVEITVSPTSARRCYLLLPRHVWTAKIGALTYWGSGHNFVEANVALTREIIEAKPVEVSDFASAGKFYGFVRCLDTVIRLAAERHAGGVDSPRPPDPAE